MINWMQKHRKALIPAIWISTIAFVGAGFVGWGAYSVGGNDSALVAKVGDTRISVKEFQLKYNNLFNYINSISDGTFTQAKADEMKLDMLAYSSIISDTMWLNLAHNLGIGASNEDVAKYLITMPEFQENGVFNKQIYLNSLARLGLKPTDFEKDLAKNVILDKLNHALTMPVNKNEIEALSSAYFIEDRLEIKVVEINPNDINATDTEIKAFWEKSKDSYKTPTSYELDTYYVSLSDKDLNKDEILKYYEDNKNLYRNADDTLKTFEEAKYDVLKNYKLEVSKNNALKKYISLKNGEITNTTKLMVSENNATFPLDEIVNKKVGEFNKPFVYEDGYLITKISKINKPVTMSYDEARKLAKADFEIVKVDKELEALAKKTVDDFNGTDIGFVSRESKIDGLGETESSIFLNELFNKPNASKGFIKVENKAIVYNITDQKLVNPDKLDKLADVLTQNAANIKNLELKTSINNKLEKRYKVEQYYKGSNLE